MRIAYVSTDEVNFALAVEMAAEYGAVVCQRLPGDPLPDGLFVAVLYNLDDVPRDERSALLEGFRRGRPGHPTAVHGYDITVEQARSLSRNGVAAARRLHPGLLRRLFTAAFENLDNVPSADAGTKLTSVDLTR
jgi:hypothetical protein